MFLGESPGAADLVSIIEAENVTFTAGVPTIFLDIIKYARRRDADLSSLERIFTGGSSIP